MKIGLFQPTVLPHSIQNYADNITRQLIALGADCSRFSENEALPENVDIYWDPRAAGGVAPDFKLLQATKPLVATVHGAAPMSVPAREYFPNWRSAIRGILSNRKHLKDWQHFRGRCSAIITVSEFARREIENHLRLHDENIIPIHHGINTDIFWPARQPTLKEAQPYFLHVSQFQPLKNLDRMFAAFNSLAMPDKPSFIFVVPGFPERTAPTGTTVIRAARSQEELAELYRDAIGFVFPSLRETFGMPILEAMASGCPVISSNSTGCAEVAGDAALLVDPRSVTDIEAAMHRLTADTSLRAKLREHGLARARQFTWQRSAEQHLKVFENALRGSNHQ